MSMSKNPIMSSKYISFFPKRWNWPLTHSLAGNGHKNCCHRPIWRRSINLGYSTSITSTARFFRPQSHPYATTTIRDSISRHFSPSCTYGIEIDRFLVLGSSHPLYFNRLCQDSKLHRFQIILKPDLSTASLRIVNTTELTPRDFNEMRFQDYRICEDSLVSSWIYSYLRSENYKCGVYMTPPLANGIPHSVPATKMLLTILSLCPASGRIVSPDSSNRVAILDYFWYICHGHGITRKFIFKRCGKISMILSSMIVVCSFKKLGERTLSWRDRDLCG